jgi:hypothetical protein
MSDGLYDNMRAYIPNKNQNGCWWSFRYIWYYWLVG